jgi:hypothetical protein
MYVVRRKPNLIMKSRANRKARSLAMMAVLVFAGSFNAHAVSSITSNFNGTNITDTSFIWFNSHITSMTGASGPVTLYFRNQKISLTSPETNIAYELSVPDAEIRIDASTIAASTAFTGGSWITTVVNVSDDPFFSGYVWDVPDGENPKASNPVTWSGDFYASVSGITIQWQWAAAVYSSLSLDNSSLGVTPIDGAGASQSGTPLNFTAFVIGGARGGGGSNYTGSNSGTATVSNLQVVPETSSACLAMFASLLCLARRRR